MSKSLTSALTQLQKIIGEIDGIRSAPDSPPERAAAFPFVVVYPRSGSFEPEGAYTATDTAIRGLHTLVLQLHVARRDLPRAYEQALPYGELIKNTIFKQVNFRLSDTVDHVVDAITYEFGGLTYAEVDTLGYSFSITVKIRNDTTTT